MIKKLTSIFAMIALLGVLTASPALAQDDGFHDWQPWMNDVQPGQVDNYLQTGDQSLLVAPVETVQVEAIYVAPVETVQHNEPVYVEPTHVEPAYVEPVLVSSPDQVVPVQETVVQAEVVEVAVVEETHTHTHNETVVTTGGDVEGAFYSAFQNAYGNGDWAVRMIRCEGWNAFAGYNLAYISPTNDYGPAQINAIHLNGVAADIGAAGLQTLDGNIRAALRVFAESVATNKNGDGTAPWNPSRHCWG